MRKNLPDFEFAQRVMLVMMSAAGDDDLEATKDAMEVLAREFGLEDQFGVVGVR